MSFGSYSRHADPSSALLCQGSGWRHGQFKREFGKQNWKAKTNEVRCPPVTWSHFPLLPPLITASDGKWWKKGEGWQGDEGIWEVKVGVMARWVCVQNVIKLRNEPQGVSLFLSYFKPSPVDLEQKGNPSSYAPGACVCVFSQDLLWSSSGFVWFAHMYNTWMFGSARPQSGFAARNASCFISFPTKLSLVLFYV